MSEREDIEALAGEYVLGTLDPGARADVAARRLGDPALDAAIVAWERRLGPLSDVVAAVPPPPGLLARIEAEIARGTGVNAPAVAPIASSAEVMALRRRLRRWQWAAGLASAAAALALVVAGVRETTRPAAVQNFVGVFNANDASPQFVLTLDLDRKVLTLRAVGAEQPRDKSYQLWIKTDERSPPRSLGVVVSESFTVGRELAVFRPEEVRGATFGVSLEPLGGSPTGQPTGPVLHATLLPATP